MPPPSVSRFSHKTSTHQQASSSSSSSSVQVQSKNKGEKRKNEDEEGVEYLRRKHNFIKSTIRTDYQPDICKDYKETGFCGFGDSCKFLHDRSDYKHGWQLDQDWSKGEYREEEDDKYLIKDEDDDADADEFSTNCPICNQEYKNPIVTKCKHFFCMDCAEKECTEKCSICDQPTSGIFKNATKLIQVELDKLKEKQVAKSSESECSSREANNSESENSTSSESD